MHKHITHKRTEFTLSKYNKEMTEYNILAPSHLNLHFL